MARARGGVLQRVLLVTFRSFPPRHVAREQLWSRGEPVTSIERERMRDADGTRREDEHSRAEEHESCGKRQSVGGREGEEGREGGTWVWAD